MAENYGASLALIRYHVWWPSSNDPYYLFNRSENEARNNYYGNNYAPHLFVDGNIDAGYNTDTWNGMIANELNVDSPLEIEISGNYDSETRDVDLEITVTATDQINNSNLKLRIALTESNLIWHAPNGGDEHNQTFRDMIPNTSGIPFSISEGQTLTFNDSFSLDRRLRADNCEIVVFVQSDNGRRILQAAKVDVISLSPDGLMPFSLIWPDDGETIYTCYPAFIWHSTYEPEWPDDVYYVVSVSADPSFPDPFMSDPITDTTWTSPVCLVYDVLYYWRVLASNGHAPDIYCSDVFTFTVVEIPPDCVYIPGDCNHNGIPLELPDIMAMIGMYRGTVELPYTCDCPPHGEDFAPEADPNGNCVPFELGDIIIEIAAYRGTGMAWGCEDCPGLRRLPPEDAPLVIPTLRTRATKMTRSGSQ